MAKIGLIDIDSKFPNLALMKISAYHKKKGDIVKFWNAFEKFDLIYGSKIFTESKFHYLPKKTILGGSGFSLEKKLNSKIEHIYPDYSLYNIDYAMGYLTRGCMNKCPFCIVWKKEGELRFNTKLEEFWNDQKKIMLLDNSITNCKKVYPELVKIRDLGIRLNLTQGFDIRNISIKMAKILSEIKLWKNKQYHIAWDNINDEKRVFKGISRLNQVGIKNWKLMCYVLINFNTSLNQDLYRVSKLEKTGIDPFVMIDNKNQSSRSQRLFAKWVNRKPIFKSCKFNEFAKSKGVLIKD